MFLGLQPMQTEIFRNFLIHPNFQNPHPDKINDLLPYSVNEIVLLNKFGIKQFTFK